MVKDTSYADFVALAKKLAADPERTTIRCDRSFWRQYVITATEHDATAHRRVKLLWNAGYRGRELTDG